MVSRLHSNQPDQGPALARFSAWSDLPMTVLTVAWLPVLVIPLAVRVHGSTTTSLDLVDYAIWALFAVEYATKLSLARHRWAYVKGHPLDLLVVAVPFLRPIRVLRIVRFLRAGSVGGDALQRARAILTHKGLHIVLLAALMVVFITAGLVTLADADARGSNIHDFGQGLWWAVVTVTTVGYGDKYPVTAFGRGVAVFLMLVGIGLIGTITASVASFFVDESKGNRQDEIVERLERIERALAAIGAPATCQEPPRAEDLSSADPP